MIRAHRNVWFALVAAFALGGTVACSAADPQASLEADLGEDTANLSVATSYAVRPSLNTSRCLAPLGGANQNGTLVGLADCDGSAAQSWSRPSTAPNTLVLFDTKCLDVVDGADYNGAQVQLWDCSLNNVNQQWVYQNGQLQWLGHTRCLDVTNGDAINNGVVMQLWDCTNPSLNQQWQLVSLAGGQNVPAVGSGSTGGAPATIPVGGYPALDGSYASSAFVPAIHSVVSQTNSSLCMSVRGFPAQATLAVKTCQGLFTERFVFDGNGRMGYPSQQLYINGVAYNKGTYCVGLGAAGSSNAGLPVVVPCNSGDSGQTWGQSGNLLVSLPHRTCLGFDPNGQDPNSIGLGACTTRPQFGWALAD